MKLSLFRIGLVLAAVGIVWISLVFAGTEKAFEHTLLKQSTSFEIRSELAGSGIGYYKVYMPHFSGERVFVQVTDTRDNVIAEESIQTRMSVGYFDFDGDGTYAVKVTNIARTPADLQVEFGDTGSRQMTPAGILILAGAVTMMIMSYLRIKNHSMAHPDENIS